MSERCAYCDKEICGCCCANGWVGVPHDCQKQPATAQAKPPREWTIDGWGLIGEIGPPVKVIEKSAYDALKHELETLTQVSSLHLEQAHAYADKRDAAEQERDAARAECERWKTAYDKAHEQAMANGAELERLRSRRTSQDAVSLTVNEITRKERDRFEQERNYFKTWADRYRAALLELEKHCEDSVHNVARRALEANDD